jgi:hypothetical protein
LIILALIGYCYNYVNSVKWYWGAWRDAVLPQRYGGGRWPMLDGQYPVRIMDGQKPESPFDSAFSGFQCKKSHPYWITSLVSKFVL